MSARHLPPVAAERFLHLLPTEIVRAMDDADFALKKSTRPFVSAKGHLLVRLVWRRRSTGACNVLTWYVTGVIGDELMDALDEAMQTDMASHA